MKYKRFILFVYDYDGNKIFGGKFPSLKLCLESAEHFPEAVSFYIYREFVVI